MTDDDARWIDALAGRSPADDAATQEARALRAGILARRVEPEAPVPAEDPAREAALIERARREGLLPVAAPFWDRRRVVATLAAAASLVLAIGLFTRAPRDPEATRGARAGIYRLEADEPAALQRRIVADLSDAGIEASAYERLSRLGVDADLPTPVPTEVLAVLQRHGIPVPADGVLTLEIVARGSP